MTSRVVDKLLFNPLPKNILRNLTNRWNCGFISKPEDDTKLRRFVQPEMTQARLNLQNDNVNNIKKIALDALNKFSSLHPHSTSDYGPPYEHKKVLQRLISPTTNDDQKLKDIFLTNIENIIRITQNSGNSGNNMNRMKKSTTDNVIFTNECDAFIPVVLGIAHVAASLIPNCISVYNSGNSVVDSCRLQFDLLGITEHFQSHNVSHNVSHNNYDLYDLTRYANKEGMSVCLFSEYNEKKTTRQDQDLIKFLGQSPNNFTMLYVNSLCD
jgi:hypothetical protein